MAKKDEDVMKKWNVPSLVAFGLTLATSIALFALDHASHGALALAAALAVLAPQPLVGDR
jgi:hypothetical protein